jgi:hypothetical protein
MAKERVQVQGLGDAVPGIQPTIQRGGQYAVQVQRAGRNKLQDLAGALSQINPLLEQYAGVAEQEAQMFEEELSRKSPEEVQAMLKKTEGELDKQVRRGAMGWLTSPLNQKRKLRAVGKLASTDLITEVQQRLLNPKQDDPEDFEERANFVRQEFISNTPALQSLFAQEGLNQSTNASIKNLVSNRELQEAKTAKEETLFATGVSFYDGINRLVEQQQDNKELQQALIRGDFSFAVDTDVNGNVITLGDQLMESWNDTNAYTPKEQRGLIKNLLTKLATNDMEDQADGLLLWAKSNLKFGNAKMSDMEFEDLQFIIDKSGEAAEDRREEENIEFVKNTTGEHKVQLAKLNLLKEGESLTYDGQTFTDKLELDRYFKQQVIDNPDLSPEQKGQIIDNVTATTQGAFRDAETHAKTLVLREAPIATAQGFEQELNTILANIEIPDIYKQRPEFRKIIRDNYNRLKPLIDKKLDEVLYLPADKAGTAVKSYAIELLQDELPKIQSAFRTAYDSVLDIEKNQRQGVPLGEKVEKPKLPEPDDDPEELIKLLPQWQSFITEDATDENSNKAKKYIEKYTPQIANETAKLALDPTRFIGGRETIPSMFLIDPDQAINLHLQYSARMDGVFTVDVLENLDDKGLAYTYAGIPFKPKELIGDVNADKFVILSQEQLDNTDTEEGLELARRAKDAAGITLDVYEFIRLQKKRRKQFIVDYVPFPDMYRPLDETEYLKNLINEHSGQQFDPLPDFIIID